MPIPTHQVLGVLGVLEVLLSMLGEPEFLCIPSDPAPGPRCPELAMRGKITSPIFQVILSGILHTPVTLVHPCSPRRNVKYVL